MDVGLTRGMGDTEKVKRIHFKQWGWGDVGGACQGFLISALTFGLTLTYSTSMTTNCVLNERSPVVLFCCPTCCFLCSLTIHYVRHDKNKGHLTHTHTYIWINLIGSLHASEHVIHVYFLTDSRIQAPGGCGEQMGNWHLPLVTLSRAHTGCQLVHQPQDGTHLVVKDKEQ